MEKPVRQKLSIDFDELFPGDNLTIGKSTVIISPLNITQIAILSKKIKGIGNLLSKEGVTWENYSEQSSLFKIAVILLDTFPDVLEEASNIDINDIKKLPLEAIVEIITKVIEVNLKSKDTLTKNFKSLTEKLMTQIPQDQKK
jgi:hypothetical protein